MFGMSLSVVSVFFIGVMFIFRPSFMNDFEKFENELSDLYNNYVLKFRILSYLEKELEGHFRNQREKVQVNSFVELLKLNSNWFQSSRKFLDNICKH